jgi:hypothetical protein
MNKRERPILFNGEMVRAILDGRKVQTRRPVKDKTSVAATLFLDSEERNGTIDDRYTVDFAERHSPFGQPGTKLWVRETIEDVDGDNWWFYRADNASVKMVEEEYNKTGHPKTIPSIHMPRWASRITLEVKRVWVERVQDSTMDDLVSEGIRCDGSHNMGEFCSKMIREFRDLWNSIYAAKGYGWDKNPWIWACEFEVIHE